MSISLIYSIGKVINLFHLRELGQSLFFLYHLFSFTNTWFSGNMLNFVTTALFASLVLWIVSQVAHRLRSKIPSPFPIPLFGHPWVIIPSMGFGLAKLHKKLGSSVEFYIFTTRFVGFANHDFVAQALKHPALFVRSGASVEGMSRLGFYDNGITLNNDLPSWSRNRKLLLHVVNSGDLLRKLSETMQTGLFNDLKNRLPTGIEFDCNQILQLHILKTLGRCLFSKTVAELSDDMLHTMHETLSNFMLALQFFVTTPPFVWKIWFWKTTQCTGYVSDFKKLVEDELIGPQIKKYHESSEEERKLKGDLVFELMNFRDSIANMKDEEEDRTAEAESSLKGTISEANINLRNVAAATDFDIMTICRDALFAGTQSTIDFICTGIFLLARHPDVQEKIFKELSSLDTETASNYKVIEGLPYLDAATHEIVRFFLGAPNISRKLASATDIGGHHFSKGDVLAFNNIAMNEDPTVWENPHLFSPERFMGSDIRQKKLKLMSFGVGPRKCPGKSTAILVFKQTIVQLINSYVLFPPSQEVKMKLLTIASAATSKDSTLIRIEKRIHQ